MTPQERALERRKTFEKDVKEKIENEVTTKWGGELRRRDGDF